ncbi:MAG: hypothetical protein GF313_12180 [Caldithrix sp.]|nr:hypothetical protein [Caldithrix sp.]
MNEPMRSNSEMVFFRWIIEIILLLALLWYSGLAQQIPAGHDRMDTDEHGKLYIAKPNGQKVYADTVNPRYTLKQMIEGPRGADNGIDFDFANPQLNGTLYYGFINHEDALYPQPVFFKRYAEIKKGKAGVDIKNQMSGKYDMVAWQQTGHGTLGYRVLNDRGQMIYEGRVSFKGTGPFKVDVTILEGPFVNLISADGATISFTLNRKLSAGVKVDGRVFSNEKVQNHHEIEVRGLQPDTEYGYEIIAGDTKRRYKFRTQPGPGSRKPFVFAYASDSRAGRGGGERDMHGTNFYIMKRIFALARQENAKFFQFSGDLINGYLNNVQETHLQYANWKRAIEPFARFMPVYVSMGNHEALTHTFHDQDDHYYSVNKFPYDTHSAEAVFAANFVNPENGPESEDGASYDPQKSVRNFPSYKENVFSYMYDNVAFVVLNSNYWYAPAVLHHPYTGGNIHAYIMDQQLEWFKHNILALEQNQNIDHVFVTLHTPFFPNGGHVGDDMWYDGNNEPRAYVKGKGVKKGIIQRRDELLDVMVNQSSKVRAILTGDEHNYNRLNINDRMERYPEGYEYEKLDLSRTIWQINNGAAGAPYYAQEKTPWSEYVQGFTTQNAVVFFHVEGKAVKVKVINPDTLEPFDQFILH